jgi:glycosyltransferase involved in cell wall biosynthesis
MKISIVIPLFNEEKHILDVLKGVRKYDYPVIVVDDGSTDESKAKVVASKLKDIKLIEHKINLGKGAAMKTGAEYAFEQGAEAVVFIDSDAQHNPEDLGKFIKSLEAKNCEVVFGSRNLNLGVPLVRYLGNKFASLLVALFFRIYVSDILCGFRAITRSAYQKIKWESTGYGVETEMVIRTGKLRMNFCEVPVETIYHSGVKGVTLLDAIGILAQVVKWRLTI